MGKAGPKSGLAERREMIAAAGDLIQASGGRNAEELYRAIRHQCKVATKNMHKGATADHNWGTMTTHQKMKVAQDFLVSAFMSPEIGVPFLQACILDPIAGAKLAISIMPKELHVDVQQQTGVVMVPMKADSLEAWMDTVSNHQQQAPKDVSPEAYWKDKMEAVDGDALAVDRDSGDGDDADTPGRHA